MHPIRRCPTDILQCIFEMAVQTSGRIKWNKYARSLSQVCYRWRFIALHTPMIWSRFALTVNSCPEYVDEMWKQYVDRIGSLPAVIRFKGITDKDSSWEAIKRCRIDLLPRVHSLILRFSTGSAARRFVTEEQNIVTNNLEHLVIESHWSEPNLDQMISPLPILTSKLFLNLRTVELGDFNFEGLDDNPILLHISTITVRKSRNLRLDLLAKIFPGVTTAEFYNIRGITHSNQIIEWPELTSLVVDATGAGYVPWNWLKLPKIVSIQLSQMRVDTTFRPFIRRHASILHLETRRAPLAGILEDAPQLISYGTVAQKNMDISALPRCLNLTLYQTDIKSLPCSLFEAIVREYFLPHTNHTGQSPIEQQREPRLTILTRRWNSPDSLKSAWRDSALLKDAIEVYSNVERWGETFQCYYLRWKKELSVLISKNSIL